MHLDIIQPIRPEDLDSVVSIHAASWYSTYRGMLDERFLDQELLADRRQLWVSRLFPLSEASFGFLAIVEGRAAGFCFAFVAADPRWGTLLDNLHVLPEYKGQGLGTALLLAFASEARLRHPDDTISLWVFDQNRHARDFYERWGARAVERAIGDAPGGGKVAQWRYVWQSPAQLLHLLKGSAGDGDKADE
jgi:GNAT superfamily N-acetyltransferase